MKSLATHRRGMLSATVVWVAIAMCGLVVASSSSVSYMSGPGGLHSAPESPVS